MLITQDDLELLLSNTVRFRPIVIVFFQNLALGDDTLAFLEHGGGEKYLLADNSIVLVVRVIGVTELTVLSKLELQELVSKFPFVTDIVSQVELRRFFRGRTSLSPSSSELS
jgi:hypothetical protein